VAERIFIDGATTDPKLQQLENDLNALLETMQTKIDTALSQLSDALTRITALENA
jgi:hypothetical protein